VAIEAEYIDIGSGGNSLDTNDDYSTTHVESSAWAAYAVGILPVPLPVVEFYGKAGIARWKLNTSLSTFIKDFPPSPSNPETTSTSSAGTGLAVGIGVQAHISIMGVRLEYEAFEVNNDYAKVASCEWWRGSPLRLNLRPTGLHQLRHRLTDRALILDLAFRDSHIGCGLLVGVLVRPGASACPDSSRSTRRDHLPPCLCVYGPQPIGAGDRSGDDH